MKKGTLYGVSVGPGDPELMTLKTVKTIKNCPVIATPATRKGETVALNIVKGAVELDGKEIMEISFPMCSDRNKLKENYRRAADMITAKLDAGMDVAMINLGDITVYSTFSYIEEIVSSEGYNTELIPGVTSFCAVAAKLKTSLTQWDEMLHVVPSSVSDLKSAIEMKGTKVIMKPGKELGNVITVLKDSGKLEKAKMVQNCGMKNERIVPNISQDESSTDYFTTLIVKD